MAHMPKSSPLTNFYGLWTKDGFHTFLMIEKILKRIIAFDILKLDKIQIPVPIEFYWNTATFT